MNDQESESEEDVLSREELVKWKVKDLKAWLETNGIKRSGNKEVLINRVHRAMQNLEDSDSCWSDDDHEAETQQSGYGSLNKESWVPVTFDNIPNIGDKDIENYFLFKKNPYSGKRAKFQRHLTKARKLCAENYLGQIMFHPVATDSEVSYVKSCCKPSMRSVVQVGNQGQTSSYYSLHVCLASTGHIISAHCNCKAGQAGLCAHVGGLLFTLVKIKNSCTTQECSWDRPRPLAKKPSPKRLFDINLHSAERTNQAEVKVHPYPDTYQASACKDPDVFLEDLLHGLDIINSGCALYKTLSATEADISEFVNLYTPMFSFADHVDLKSPACISEFESFLAHLCPDDELVQRLEIGTRGQAINNNWLTARSFLITASNMGDVCKRQKSEPDKLVLRLRGYNPPSPFIKSLRHGRKYERKALKDYSRVHSEQCGETIDVDSRGLKVNAAFPFLGASIDGLVNCTKCGIGLVETKCPYGSQKTPWRNMRPQECATDKNFYCDYEENSIKLKKNHNYWYQLQGQMGVCGLKWVDFVVWTKQGLAFERHTFDEAFWNTTMLPKLKSFYLSAMIPEMYTSRVKRNLKLYSTD